MTGPQRITDGEGVHALHWLVSNPAHEGKHANVPPAKPRSWHV